MENVVLFLNLANDPTIERGVSLALERDLAGKDRDFLSPREDEAEEQFQSPREDDGYFTPRGVPTSPRSPRRSPRRQEDDELEFTFGHAGLGTADQAGGRTKVQADRLETQAPAPPPAPQQPDRREARARNDPREPSRPEAAVAPLEMRAARNDPREPSRPEAAAAPREMRAARNDPREPSWPEGDTALREPPTDSMAAIDRASDYGPGPGRGPAHGGARELSVRQTDRQPLGPAEGREKPMRNGENCEPPYRQADLRDVPLAKRIHHYAVDSPQQAVPWSATKARAPGVRDVGERDKAEGVPKLTIASPGSSNSSPTAIIVGRAQARSRRAQGIAPHEAKIPPRLPMTTDPTRLAPDDLRTEDIQPGSAVSTPVSFGIGGGVGASLAAHSPDKVSLPSTPEKGVLPEAHESGPAQHPASSGTPRQSSPPPRARGADDDAELGDDSPPVKALSTRLSSGSPSTCCHSPP